eukprot:Pgem_evm1s17726
MSMFTESYSKHSFLMGDKEYEFINGNIVEISQSEDEFEVLGKQLKCNINAVITNNNAKRERTMSDKSSNSSCYSRSHIC